MSAMAVSCEDVRFAYLNGEVTPEIETRRYDTRFFVARMPDGQTAKHDESETTALEWLSPSEAILVVGLPKVKGSTGGPVRLIALI
jgi:hypothetical protein